MEVALHRLFGSGRRWVLLPVVLFLLTQVFATGLLLHEKPRQEAIPAGDGFQYFVRHHAANPPWVNYVAGWNGQAYREIATEGYPVAPPRTSDGEVLPNPWAFYPLYPGLVHGVMALTGLEFGWAAVLVSLLFGLAASVLLFRLIHTFTGRLWPATAVIASLLLWPTSPLFQLGYAESTALFLLVLVLTLIHEKRYLWAILPILLLGLTRPVGPPDAALVVLDGLYLGRAYLWPRSQWRLGLAKLRSREALSFMALVASTVVAAGLWPLIGWLATGENAFVESRSAYSGESFFLQWLTHAFDRSEAYPLTPAVLILFFGLWAFLQFRNRMLPMVLRLWTPLLFLYILLVTAPAGNEERYLMLGLFAWPWLEPPSTGRRRAVYWAAAAGAALVAFYLQWSWVHFHWVSETGALRKNV